MCADANPVGREEVQPTLPLAYGGGSRRIVHVDLAELTPRAASLARIWSATPLHTPCPVILESVRTIREMGGTEERDGWFYSSDMLDRPHRIVWDSWSKVPPDPQVPVARRLEVEVQKWPMGYVPISAHHGDDDTDHITRAQVVDILITRAQVVDILKQRGRPLSPMTIANYRQRPPAGWPQPVKYVGRTPLWDPVAVEAYASRSETVTLTR